MACHKLIHFNSLVCILDFTWSNCTLLEAKKFSRNPRQFKWVSREIRCHLFILELLKQNLLSQVEESFQRHRTILKIIFLGGDHQFFYKSPRIKFLYDRGRKRFQLPAGIHLTWHLDRVFVIFPITFEFFSTFPGMIFLTQNFIKFYNYLSIKVLYWVVSTKGLSMFHDICFFFMHFHN